MISVKKIIAEQGQAFLGSPSYKVKVFFYKIDKKTNFQIKMARFELEFPLLQLDLFTESFKMIN